MDMRGYHLLAQQESFDRYIKAYNTLVARMEALKKNVSNPENGKKISNLERSIQ